LSLGACRAPAEKPRALPFAEARPQEEPDGKPHRSGTQFLRRVVQQRGSIEFRVINIAANGPVVMTERVDVFKLPNKSFELQVMGTFEVSGGKISAWRDYFDMNQFTSRMG
jgi:limonene-1,2-epoxide hydrolase